MFHPFSNTARTHAHTSISMLKSLVNFCSRDFLFHKEFDDSTLAKQHIVVGHFVRSDTGHVMQAIRVTRHSRITQHLVPFTTALSFVCCSQFACKKMLLMTYGTTLVAQVWKIELTVVFPWKHFEYPSLISLQNLLWRNGWTDMCVKGNTLFSGKEKDLPEPPKNWMVAWRGRWSPTNNWDRTHTKWINQRGKAWMCQCYIIRTFPTLYLFLPFLPLLLLLLFSPPPTPSLLCMP